MTARATALLRLAKRWLWDTDFAFRFTGRQGVVLTVLSALTIMGWLYIHNLHGEISDPQSTMDLTIFYPFAYSQPTEHPTLADKLLIAGIGRIFFGMIIGLLDVCFYRRIVSRYKSPFAPS